MDQFTRNRAALQSWLDPLAGMAVNVVFDLGGVVVTWQPHALIARQFADPALGARIYAEVIAHDDWLALDRGTLDLNDAIARAAERVSRPRTEIAEFFRQVPLSLELIAESRELMRKVKRSGQALYCLSNMAHHSLVYLERRYDFWQELDGRVVSCLVNMIKPEPAIYAHLLEAHRLRAAETVFIDDLQVNLDAAAAFGMKTIRFVSPAQCERELRALGCLRSL